MSKFDMADMPIAFGSAIKDLGGGRIGGHLILFGTPDSADLDGDFFTAETDFGLDVTTKSAMIFHHGFDKTLKRRRLGVGEMKSDDVGIWIEGVLEERDEYDRAIKELIRKGKLGWSSGTAPHLVERTEIGKSTQITRWPLGLDASLTATPCDPRNRATILPLKYWQSKNPSPLAAKESRMAPDHKRSATHAALNRMHDHLGYALSSLVYDDDLDEEERLRTAHETIDEYMLGCLEIIEALLKEEQSEETAEEAKAYMRQFQGRVLAIPKLTDLSETVLAAVRGLTDRFTNIDAKRTAEKRAMSAARREEIKTLIAALEGLLAGAQKAVVADGSDVAAQMRSLRLKAIANMATLGLTFGATNGSSHAQ